MLLSKYDLNRNGVIDPDEKGEALADPAFIKSQFSSIAGDCDYWLMPKQLEYFDANKNRLLEPAEQAGIETALDLQAEHVFNSLDFDADGLIDRAEYNELAQIIADSDPRSFYIHSVPFPDDNKDRRIDAGELGRFLMLKTIEALRPRPFSDAGVIRPTREASVLPSDPRLELKHALEKYWQDATVPANR